MIMRQICKIWILLIIGIVKECYSFQEKSKGGDPPKIAMIGGGIGGTSAAYFLNELLGDDIILDLYERDRIGGRLATLLIGENVYEVGGSVLHPRNEYMSRFASEFGLAKIKGCGGQLGFFDGEEYVFRNCSWYYLNLAKLFWRYGWDVYRLNRLTEDMLGSLAKIYSLQEKGNAFKDVEDLLKAMDPRFPKMAHSSSSAWLKELGFHDLMIQELVMAMTEYDYGQTPDIQAFVGAFAVAFADPNLWSVSGGNKRIPEELLKSSGAAWIKRMVTGIAQNEEGSFTVTSVDAEIPFRPLFSEGSALDVQESEDQIPHSQDYDMVIIATPLTKDKSNINFVNFTKDFQFSGHYERIVCTMVQGKIKPKGLKFSGDESFDEILVTNPGLIFNYFGKQRPVDTNDCSKMHPDVWKIFSPLPLPESQLKIFFEEWNSTDVIDWLAYPHYNSDQQLPSFELVPGMYHVNAIEWAGSAMEIEVIGAKNAALLAYKYWKQDPSAGGKDIKDEL